MLAHRAGIAQHTQHGGRDLLGRIAHHDEGRWARSCAIADPKPAPPRSIARPRNTAATDGLCSIIRATALEPLRGMDTCRIFIVSP